MDEEEEGAGVVATAGTVGIITGTTIAEVDTDRGADMEGLTEAVMTEITEEGMTDDPPGGLETTGMTVPATDMMVADMETDMAEAVHTDKSLFYC